MWLLNLTNHRINEFVPVHQQGTGEAQSQATIQWAFNRFKNNKANQLILGDNYTNVPDTGPSSCPVMLPITRSQRNVVGGRDSRAQRNGDNGGDSTIHTPAADSILGESQEGPTSDSQVTPVIRERKISWERQPREPLPPLKDVKEWVGKQLDHENLPRNIKACHRKENSHP